MSAVVARQSGLVLTDRQFDAFRKLVKGLSGIALADSKRQLVQGRLSRRLRALRMPTFAEYHELLSSPQGAPELIEFTNALTTNLTSFFRESHHFDYLRDHLLLPRVRDTSLSRRIRIWCAAASTGEEPWSIAMTVAEAIPDWERWDIRILATDIDTQVLGHCAEGAYRMDRFEGMPRSRMERFFDACSDASGEALRIKPSLAKMVHFRQLNLVHALPMHGPLDAIFCRNVIIYFDKETQRALFRRMAPLQRPGDLLFLGHSESLFSVSGDWSLIGRTIHRRNA